MNTYVVLDYSKLYKTKKKLKIEIYIYLIQNTLYSVKKFNVLNRILRLVYSFNYYVLRYICCVLGLYIS